METGWFPTPGSRPCMCDFTLGLGHGAWSLKVDAKIFHGLMLHISFFETPGVLVIKDIRKVTYRKLSWRVAVYPREWL